MDSFEFEMYVGQLEEQLDVRSLGFWGEYGLWIRIWESWVCGGILPKAVKKGEIPPLLRR